MKSVTADTNIYISGLRFSGLPEQFINLARARAIRLNISDEIMAEVLRVLRDKFEYSQEMLRQTEANLASITHRVKSDETLDVIQSDPSDNRILECAVAAKSDYIVSGDTRHVLPLGSFGGIPIVRVAEFLRQFQWEVGEQR